MICGNVNERSPGNTCERETHDDGIHVNRIGTEYPQAWPVTADPEDMKATIKLLKRLRKVA
jgi:hypothetical protein